MATWSEFESAAPEMAAAGRKLLYQYGMVGLAFLATVRKDGAPRLHPVSPTILEDTLYVLIGDSHKRRDLERDGRYALHTLPPRDVDDEFLVMGHAARVLEALRVETARAHYRSRGMTLSDEDLLFAFSIERAMHAKYPGGHGTWPPKYTVWRSDDLP